MYTKPPSSFVYRWYTLALLGLLLVNLRVLPPVSLAVRTPTATAQGYPLTVQASPFPPTTGC